MSGKLYAVGLGPGDPELLTIKAQRLLTEADVVFLPVQDEHDSVARKIMAGLVDAGRLRELSFRMSRKAGENRQRWQEHAATVAAAVAQGQTAVFATEGDPLLYSTFVHVYTELLRSHPDLPVEIVPGVSSVTAGAAALRIPLADDKQRVAIVPAMGEVMHALATFDSVVILKASMAIDTVLKALHTTGRTEQAIYIERAGWPEQRVVEDVESLRKQKLDYFGQIIVARR
ncbi:MAG TPA: precorrin-2 C(20)-methyltransferase [Chloroflexota bacterium]|nr:precorrin-2 C(20)-methyltransferase [Chloroflexota bacterium]